MPTQINMKSKLFLSAVILSAAFCANAQESKPKAMSRQAGNSVEKPEKIKEKTSPNDSDRTTQPATQTQPPYVRPDSGKRFNNYLKSVAGHYAIGGIAFGAGIRTATNSPEEWGKKWEGFGRRFASGLGINAIEETTAFALDETFKLDSRFYRSRKKDFRSRVGNALISAVTARNKNGKRVFGFPRIAGGYAANVIAYETWYPSRYNYQDGLQSGTIAIGTNALFNLFREFVFK